jgi:malonyl CoA-acyl carrier protein transacylase
MSLPSTGSGLDNLPADCQPAVLALLAAEDRRQLIVDLGALRDRVAEAGIAGLPAAPPRGGPCRVALLATDAADLIAKTEAAIPKLASFEGPRLVSKGSLFYGSGAAETGKTVFLFPGQGSQHTGMLAELCALLPGVRAWFEDLDRSVAGLPIPAPSLLAFPPADGLTEAQRAALQRELYDLRGGAQLGLVSDLALYELVVDLGLRPDIMVGHSNGEHAALFASKTFHAGRRELFDAIRRMVELAIRLPPPAEPELVVTVGLRDRARLDELIAAESGELFFSMINCPSQCVLAGRAAAVERASRKLAKEGAIVVRLPLERAYHTPLFATWGRFLHQLYEETSVGPGEVPLYACMTGAPYPADPERIRAMAAEQWSNPVDFEKTVRQLYADGVRLFVEIGPDNKLKGFVDDVLRGREHLAVSTSSARHPALEQLLRFVGELFVHGVDLDFGSATWRALQPRQATTALATTPGPVAEDGEQLAIVTAHFELMQQFLASQARILELVSAESPSPPARTEWPLLGVEIRRTAGFLETERQFDLERDPLLRDHSLGPAVPATLSGPRPLAILPFTFSMEIVAQAACSLFGGVGEVVRMMDLRAYRWLSLDRGRATLRIRAEAHPELAGIARVRVLQMEDGGRGLLAFEGDVEVAETFPPAPAARPSVPGLPGPRLWSSADFYDRYAFHGPTFQGIRAVRGIGGEALEAALETPPAPPGPPAESLLAPALLDCSGQMVGFWLLENGRSDFGIFPFHLKDFRVFGRPPRPGDALEGRAAVTWQEHAGTRADVDFCAGERLIYRAAGLEQRYLPLPPCFARALLGSQTRPRQISVPVALAGAVATRAVEGLPHSFLAGSWGIWGRALAHLILSAAELDDWYERRARSLPWLLGRLAAKETIQAWAAEAYGLELRGADLELDGEEDIQVRSPQLTGPHAAPPLRLLHDGERVVARLEA